jgi:hypothetical protein
MAPPDSTKPNNTAPITTMPPTMTNMILPLSGSTCLEHMKNAREDGKKLLVRRPIGK